MCDKNQPGKWTHSKRQLKHSHPLFEEGNILCSILVKQLPFDASVPEGFSDPRYVPVSEKGHHIYKYPVLAFLKIRPLNLKYMFNMSFSFSDPNGIPCGISGCNKILDCLNR